RTDRCPLRRVLALVLEYHAHCAFPDFGRISRGLLHSSILSRNGASGKVGPVQLTELTLEYLANFPERILFVDVPGAPAATLNSPIRGRVKFPQLTAAGRCVFTRSERALQLERRPPSGASSCPRTSADASDASGGRAAA